MAEREKKKREPFGLKVVVDSRDPVVRAQLRPLDRLGLLTLPQANLNTRGEIVEVETGHVLPCPLSE